MNDEPILLLYQYPTTLLQRVIVWIKIFLKEGVLYQNWGAAFNRKKVGGNTSLPIYIQKGLNLLKIKYISNVFNVSAEIKTVYVAKDVRCLRWAIAQKKIGAIQKLVAGPMIVNSPEEYDYIIEDPSIDLVLLPSQWIIDYFRKNQRRTDVLYAAWPLGIDVNYWIPQLDAQKVINFLIYSKNPDSFILKFIKDNLDSKNISYKVIKSGTFSQSEYKAALQSSRAVIFLSRTETQGLAIFEAWACNKPTLHWNPGIMNYMHLKYDKASSCPYLTDECGLDFKDVDEFPKKLAQFLNTIESFRPREYILREYTLEKSMQKLAKYLLK